jgi:hypothetical protein
MKKIYLFLIAIICMAKVHATTTSKNYDFIKKKHHNESKIKIKEKPFFIPALQIMASYKECCDVSKLIVSVLFIQFDTETKEIENVQFINTGNTCLANCS